jgi:hypothetical protein
MAITDYIPNIFGSTPEVYRGLLDAPERASLENRANIGGLLGFAGALAQGMSPQGYRRSAAQNILTALGAGYGAAGQTYESGLNQVSNVMKLAQAKRQISGLAAMKTANPDIAYLADVSPDEFVRLVSARERAKRYGLLTNPNAAPNAAPSAATNAVPSAAPAVVEPPAPAAGLMASDGGGFLGGGYGSVGTGTVQPAPAAPPPAAPPPAVPSPAAPVPAPSAATPSATKNILVSPEDQAKSDRLYAAAVEAELYGDKAIGDEYRRQAKILNPDETITFRDGYLVSSRRGVLMKVFETKTLTPAEAIAERLPTDRGQVYQRDPSGKISRIEGTESTELDKAELLKILPGQFTNIYPTLRNRADNLISRASKLTRDQINEETKAILDADSKILADLDPKLQAAEMARRKASATVLYPPGAVVPGKEGQNIVDKELLTLGAGRMQLQGIAQKFDPKYLTAGFQVKMKLLGTQEYLTGKIAEKDKALLNDYAAFTQDAYGRLNSYINEVTGAAVGSGEEEARIRKGVPDPQKDSPTEFLSKLRNKIQEGRLFEARLAYIKSKGLKKLTDVKVDDVPRLMREREDQIYRENKFDKKNKDHQEIVKRVLATEFGLLE